MKYLTIFCLLLLVGCSGKNPIGPSTTPDTPTDSTFAGTLVNNTIRYDFSADPCIIYADYSIPFDGSYEGMDSVVAEYRDTVEWRVFLSNGKCFHSVSPIYFTGNPPPTLLPRVFFANEDNYAWFSTYVPNLVVSDSSTHVDSILVTYTHWDNLIRYGPHTNRHRNPTVVKTL